MYLSKRPGKNYFVYYKQENGKKTRVSTKTTLKSEALKFLNDFEKRIKQKSARLITLKEFSFEYLKNVSITHTNNSYRLTKYIVENFLNKFGDDQPLIKIDKSMVENYILNIYVKSKYSAALSLRVLKAYFNKAISLGYIEKNPLQGMKLRIPTNHPTYISVNELNLILEKESELIFKQIFEFAFYTGMRISEILNLEWADIDLVKREMKIQNKEGFTTKSKKERVIPMNKKIFNILYCLNESKPNDVTYIFNSNGEKFNKTFVSKRFKQRVRDAGLSDRIHFHSLRHSFASLLVQKGVNLFYVQKLLGHSQISTTQVYAHLRNEDLQAAVKSLD